MQPLSTLTFTIIVVSVILAGIILFILTGIINVKKKHVAIIEKAGNYVGTYKSGAHYFAPIAYRRVGMYPIGEIKLNTTIDRKDYILKYKITNVKMFHYSGHHDVASVLKASLKDSKDNLSEALINRYTKIGIEFISLERCIKNTRQ